MHNLLIVPGLGGSGPDHWQTWLHEQTHPSSAWVEQADWHTPDLLAWSARLDENLLHAPAPVWLIAHSFGCLASVHAGVRRPAAVAGALLVAPADPERFDIAPLLPQGRLPFMAWLIGSRNDPWMPYPTALQWASRWGCRALDWGRAGHINPAAGYGAWPAVLNLVRELQQNTRQARLGRPMQISGVR